MLILNITGLSLKLAQLRVQRVATLLISGIQFAPHAMERVRAAQEEHLLSTATAVTLEEQLLSIMQLTKHVQLHVPQDPTYPILIINFVHNVIPNV